MSWKLACCQRLNYLALQLMFHNHSSPLALVWRKCIYVAHVYFIHVTESMLSTSKFFNNQTTIFAKLMLKLVTWRHNNVQEHPASTLVMHRERVSDLNIQEDFSFNYEQFFFLSFMLLIKWKWHFFACRMTCSLCAFTDFTVP